MTGDSSIPPSRDLPPGRLAQRREHLISEIAEPRARWPLPRRGSLALVAALIVVVVGTASAFGSMRDFFFTPRINSKIAYIHNSGPGGQAPTPGVPWSPDKELWVMNADGSDARRLSRIASWGPHAWSPDGKKIAFMRDTRAIYVVNADGSGQRRLRSKTFDGPVWSPDGRKIAFTARGPGTGSGGDVYVMNADGSGERNLTRTPGTDFRPAWSPDGRTIAFVSDRDGNWDVYVMNADGSDQRNLTRDPATDIPFSSLAWSPDGRTIAWASERDGNFDIHVMNADGRGRRNLTRTAGGGIFPAWSPDGRRIAFVRGRGNNSDIYVMNADGSGTRRLAEGGNWAPDWSPDGRKIAFAGPGSEIYVVNADGSGQRALTRTPRANASPRWSPGEKR
jgi:Tol biopolymer transport system component